MGTGRVAEDGAQSYFIVLMHEILKTKKKKKHFKDSNVRLETEILLGKAT